MEEVSKDNVFVSEDEASKSLFIILNLLFLMVYIRNNF